MKEGWEYSTIGKLCKTYSGGTPLKNVKEYYQDGNIPWLRSGEVCKKYIYETEMFITQKGLESSSAKYYPIDTVVVAMYGATAAQVSILKIEATSNQAVCGILPNSKFVPEFLYYFFCYRKNFLASQAQGGAQPNISQVKIKNLEIPVPPLSEQQRIVDYLDATFAKIDAMKANAGKALNEAKALFQAALKEMLEPKEGWEEKKLKEITSEIGDGLHGTPKYTDDGNYYFVNGSNFENGLIKIKDNTKRVGFEEYEKYRINLNSSTVLLSINGTIGKTAFYNGESIILGKSACYINVLPTLLKEYLRFFLLSEFFMIYANKNARQATIINLGLKEIRNMPIPIPPLSEQQRIVETLDTLKSKVDRLQANFDKVTQECDALKQAILRQVFE
ncbi:MAG: restriction endonuclease subunit S [Prevotella sp.]|nr:restriction endonuclease subunit S [Prevotella sp.]